MLDTSQVTPLSITPAGPNVTIAWTGTVPAGGQFQVYVDGSLQYHGFALKATVPVGLWYDIGTVGPGEGSTDFSAYLPPRPRSRAMLTWLGGTFEGQDILGFRIFGEDTPGGGIDYTTPLADLEAYVPGIVTDGYGMGGYGQGGYGAAAGSYSWESEPHQPTGVWHFAIVPYDQVGNLGAGTILSGMLTALPAEVPVQSDGSRLHCTYSATTKEITLTWLASPG